MAKNVAGSVDTVVYTIVRPPNPWTKRLLHFGDTLLSLFIISPLVVAHWRGTWNLMDTYPDYFPPWNCMILGGILHTVFALLRETLHTSFAKKKKKTFSMKVRQWIATRLYTYLFSMGCNMHWRGGWAVMKYYFDDDLLPALTISTGCFILLITFKSIRNIIAPPVIILTDLKEVCFDFPTRFRIEGSREPGLYVLDCMFSVLFIGSLVVFVWRGAWVFLDLALFPGEANKGKSSLGSLVIGYVVVGITFALQPLMRWACERLEGIKRIITADIFLCFSFIGTVNVWRGVWGLLDAYFLPDDKFYSDLITHVVSLVLLALLNCSNSVLVRGVYIDAEEPAGQCVIFPVYYIRLFFQKERTKKQKHLLDLLEKQDPNNLFPLLEKKPSSNHHVIVPTTKQNTHHIKSEKNSNELDSTLKQ